MVLKLGVRANENEKCYKKRFTFNKAKALPNFKLCSITFQRSHSAYKILQGYFIYKKNYTKPPNLKKLMLLKFTRAFKKNKKIKFQ